MFQMGQMYPLRSPVQLLPFHREKGIRILTTPFFLIIGGPLQVQENDTCPGWEFANTPPGPGVPFSIRGMHAWRAPSSAEFAEMWFHRWAREHHEIGARDPPRKRPASFCNSDATLFCWLSLKGNPSQKTEKKGTTGQQRQRGRTSRLMVFRCSGG